MTNIGARFAVLSLITGLAVLNTAEAQEKKIKRQELPPAVEKTVAEQSQGATIKGFSTEVEAGKTPYEVELTVKGHGKDISMDKDGKIVAPSTSSMPPPVKCSAIIVESHICVRRWCASPGALSCCA